MNVNSDLKKLLRLAGLHSSAAAADKSKCKILKKFAKNFKFRTTVQSVFLRLAHRSCVVSFVRRGEKL